LQHLAVAVGGIRCQSLRQLAITCAIAFDHVSGRELSPYSRIFLK
jgi:hypothetical protein